MEPLRILIADDEPIIRLDLRQLLENMGHTVIGEAGDGETAVTLARQLRPDLILLDVKMPGKDGIEAAGAISRERIAPVIILTAYGQGDLIERAKNAGVFNYLVKPFKETDLFPAVEVALSRWREYIEIEEKVGQLEDALETRKLVDRAKGILMKKYGLSEPEAFRRIQIQSMKTRKPMKDLAEALILAEEV
ncbi:MAG: response regulator [Armatimonadetes bacterium]|nr:response regulator [Armatimonadota bacterium]